MLTVPSGFEFNPDASVTVLVGGGIGPQTINGVSNGGTIPVAVTPTTLTFTVTSRSGAASSAGITLTFQNIQVRPTAATPLASGNLIESGTCNLTECDPPLGHLGLPARGRRIAGGVSDHWHQLRHGRFPDHDHDPEELTNSAIRRATAANETLIFSGCGTVGAYAPTINGSPDAFTTGIPVTFDASGSATVTLIDYLAETATLNVTDGTTSSTTGLSITSSPEPASAFAFDSVPAAVTYGSTFNVVVRLH